MTAVETYLELNHRATARCAGCFPDHTRGLALLLAASRPGGATQKEISKATGAPDYTVTKLMKPLQKQHLVKVTRDDRNPKLKRVQLAAKGKKLLAQLETELNALLSEREQSSALPSGHSKPAPRASASRRRKDIQLEGQYPLPV